MISAEIIADSVSPEGIRLTTMQLRYPKFIHGEFMTHRVFSRNASSSRAIPTAKLIEEVRSDAMRATPVFWGANQPGMQAMKELDDFLPDNVAGTWMSPRQWAAYLWKCAALDAAINAERLHKLGAHKQIVNRILEPFSHINVLVTATEWDNFFGLRLHKDAQPEMRALAAAMWEARGGSTAKLLQSDEWHLPFVGQWDYQECLHYDTQDEAEHTPISLAIRVSVARCARVSYLSNDTGKHSTIEEDLKLYDRLMGAQPLHASPAEHQATPDKPLSHTTYALNGEARRKWKFPHQHGNFRGWCQYRKTLAGEHRAPLPKGYSK